MPADFYGLPLQTTPLNGHLFFIKHGGYVEKKGERFGAGLEHHYRKAMDLMWPDLEWHRWRDMGHRRICEEEINVLMGPSDSAKTTLMASFILTDWWSHLPDCLWMVSSTELRGAELGRIWGQIKALFNKARARFPWLPGQVLESWHCVTAEQISDDGSAARLLTRGIIFIPCKSNNQWVGMSAYVGIKPTDCGRLGHCGDECSMMQRSFLDAYANWYGKPKFKGILAGNPLDIEDCLCIAAEPEAGWSNWHDTGKTQEWRSRWYGAWVTCYDGRDSPNLDYPADQPTRYPYLLGRKKFDAVLKNERGDQDSPIFRSQVVGKPIPGQEKFKVITWHMCEQNHAFDDVMWEGERTLGGSLDAAYGGEGGDRCVAMFWEFGRDVSGRVVFLCHEPQHVPIKPARSTTDPDAETQIARWCKNYFTGLGVAPSNFFFDARASLALKLSNEWSTDVNVVDFGGSSTKRPVSNDEFVEEIDAYNQRQRRLMRCDEKYYKFVSELWFTARYTILSGQMRGLNKVVAEEGVKRVWRYTKTSPPRMEVETKKEMKERTKQSPDYFDCLVTGLEGARRLGFTIETMRDDKTVNPADQYKWFDIEIKKRRDFLKRHELNTKV